MMRKLYKKYRYSLILLRELVIADFKLRYQGSVLGYVWTLLRPLFLFAILYVVFVHFLRIGGDIPYWPVAMLLGIVLWNFFTEVTNNGVSSIVNRGDVIRKLNFPRYVIVVAGTISAFINLLLNLVVIAVFMLLSGVELTWLVLLSPLLILEVLVFALGIAFLLSALYVKIRDINYVWEIILQGMFYASAVIYPIALVIETSERMAQLLLLNPVAQAIQDMRYALINQEHTPTLASLSDNPYMMGIPLAIVVGVFVLGVVVFKKQSPSFAENV